MQIDCFPDAPSEWLRSTVSDIAEINPPYCIDKQKEYPFLEMAAVAEGFGGILGYDRRKAENTGLCRFKSGDILFGKITPCAENGKVALVEDLPDEFGLGSTEFIVLSPRDGENPNFIYALVCASPFHGRAVSRMEGSTGRLRITQDVFKKWLLVPVPENEEQNAIVRVLKSTDDAIAFAQAELAAARRLKTALMQQLFTKGIPGRHRKTQAIEVFRRCVEIPKDWEPARLGPNTTMIQYGTNAASNDYRAGYPVIAIPQVVASRLELGDVPYADLGDDEANELRLMENDVLLIRTNGNPDYMGKSTLVTSEVARSHVVFASYLIRVRTDEDLIRGAYLNYFLASPLGRRQALAMANTSAGNHNLGARSLKQFWIPLPDPAEQDEIVSILHQCEDSIDALKAKTDVLLRLKKSLLQNLLTGKVRVTTGGGA